MTKHKTMKRKIHKGGGFLDYIGLGNSQTNIPSQSWGDWFSSMQTKAKDSTSSILNSADMAVGNINEGTKSVYNSANNFLTTDVNMNIQPNTNSIGGKRKRRFKAMKSKTMKGGLGLTYYATPVSGLKVAEPTNWQYYANGTNQYTVKGGTKRRYKSKRRRTKK